MAIALMASQEYVDRKFQELKDLLEIADKDKRTSETSGSIMLRGLQFINHPVLHM